MGGTSLRLEMASTFRVATEDLDVHGIDLMAIVGFNLGQSSPRMVSNVCS